ncbi:hypothetical protein SAMN05216566_1454 [Aureimonas phyllosphaerae]|nr:hypothetical protein SAMN05216566_1454 [Aureimonas phyllosphaerae]
MVIPSQRRECGDGFEGAHEQRSVGRHDELGRHMPAHAVEDQRGMSAGIEWRAISPPSVGSWIRCRSRVARGRRLCPSSGRRSRRYTPTSCADSVERTVLCRDVPGIRRACSSGQFGSRRSIRARSRCPARALPEWPPVWPGRLFETRHLISFCAKRCGRADGLAKLSDLSSRSTMVSFSDIWNASKILCARSLRCKRIMPCTAGIGPLFTIRARAWRCSSFSLGKLPGALRLTNAARPNALNRST